MSDDARGTGTGRHRLLYRPLTRLAAGRGGAAALAALLLAGVLVAALGAGYTAAHPTLGDGSAYLAKGDTVAHLNGETGRSDAELALRLATGGQTLQPVKLPDGRVAIVNTGTGQVTFIDPATMAPTGTPVTGSTAGSGGVAAVPTSTDGYLVDTGHSTVEEVPTPGRPTPPPVRVADGIAAAVPAGSSVWVLTRAGYVLAVEHGALRRSIQLPAQPAGLTVADGHPVVATVDGSAYTVDGAQPRLVGDLDLTGTLLLGSWQGADRWALAVRPSDGRFAALDPRSGRLVTLTLPGTPGRAVFGAPVTLGGFAYVPEYDRPALWRVDLTAGRADARPLEVHGGSGPFELKVSGGLVWASNQYDRRVLVVDRDGVARYADKGPGDGVTDSGRSGGSGPAGPATSPGTDPPTSGPDQPGPQPGDSPGDQPDGASPSTPPTGPRVTVPSFRRGTTYQQACAQLRALRLRCDPVAAGDQPGRATGEVIDTNPVAGAQVPEQSRVLVRYVGPVQVPDVVGQTRARACQRIAAAGLTCRAVADPDPAATPVALGVVTSQDPGANQPLAKGGTVTVRYPDRIALPSFAGQTDAAACQTIQTVYQMRCAPSQGTPGGPGRPVGQVYDQSPAAGSTAAIGATVSVVSYAGAGQLGTFTGLLIADACARVTQAGYQCQQVEGSTAAGTGEPAGNVYAQDPAPGTTLALGGTVTLTYRSGNNALPSYTGADITAACADIQAHNFVCAPSPVLAPSTNVVVGQSPGPGTYPLGSTITVQYSPWPLVEYSIYRHDTLNVWALRPTGQAPAGYGGPSYRVGLGYAPGTAIPGARTINGFYCTASAARCYGLNPNHFYSAIGSYPNPDWNGPNPIAVFMSCGAPGARRIYRTWLDQGGIRYYTITDSPGAVTGSEDLGCVW